MRIEEIINQLKNIKEEHGNLIATTVTWDEPTDDYVYNSIDEIAVFEDEECINKKFVIIQ